jgi:hypothetical protein
MDRKMRELMRDIELKSFLEQNYDRELVKLKMVAHDIKEEIDSMLYEAKNMANLAIEVEKRAAHNGNRLERMQKVPHGTVR